MSKKRTSAISRRRDVPYDPKDREGDWRKLDTPDDMVEFYDPTDVFGDLADALAEAFPAIAPEFAGASTNDAGDAGDAGTDGDAADSTDYEPTTWLQGLYARGAGGYFDGVAHHPYSFPCDPLTNAVWNSFTQTPVLYFVMAANGDGNKKVWGTEVGAPTGADVGVCARTFPSRLASTCLIRRSSTNAISLGGSATLIWRSGSTAIASATASRTASARSVSARSRDEVRSSLASSSNSATRVDMRCASCSIRRIARGSWSGPRAPCRYSSA